MDKVLIAAFATALVGLIVAAVNLVKLVNDKEGNVTDVKQAWALSFRSTLAELMATAHSCANELYTLKRNQVEHAKILLAVKENTPNQIELQRLNLYAEAIKLNLGKCKEYEHNLQLAYATTKLHFKPDDNEFAPIDVEIKKCLAALDELQDVKNMQHWIALKKVVSDATSSMASQAMSVLHVEWAGVKAGEPIYKRTKIGTLIFLGVMALALAFFGWFVFSNYDKDSEARPMRQVIDLRLR